MRVREFEYEIIESFDYDKLKLFFMSVLLRADLSEGFYWQRIRLGNRRLTLKKHISKGIAPGRGVMPNAAAASLFLASMRATRSTRSFGMRRYQGMGRSLGEMGDLLGYLPEASSMCRKEFGAVLRYDLALAARVMPLRRAKSQVAGS